MDLGTGEDGQMGKAPNDINCEIKVTAGILDPGDIARIALVEPPHHLWGDRNAAYIGEMIEVKAQVRHRSPIDDGRKISEGRVFGDATSVEGRRHQQNAVDALQGRVAGKANDIGNCCSSNRHNNPARRDARSNQRVQGVDALFDGKFCPFAGGAKNCHAITASRQHRTDMAQPAGEIGAKVGCQGGCNSNGQTARSGQSFHHNLMNQKNYKVWPLARS